MAQWDNQKLYIYIYKSCYYLFCIVRGSSYIYIYIYNICINVYNTIVLYCTLLYIYIYIYIYDLLGHYILQYINVCIVTVYTPVLTCMNKCMNKLMYGRIFRRLRISLYKIWIILNMDYILIMKRENIIITCNTRILIINIYITNHSTHNNTMYNNVYVYVTKI